MPCCAEVEITFLPFDNLHSKVYWIIQNYLLGLVRKNAVTSHVADIRFVPIELDVGRLHVTSKCTSVVGTAGVSGCRLSTP